MARNKCPEVELGNGSVFSSLSWALQSGLEPRELPTRFPDILLRGQSGSEHSSVLAGLLLTFRCSWMGFQVVLPWGLSGWSGLGTQLWHTEQAELQAASHTSTCHRPAHSLPLFRKDKGAWYSLQPGEHTAYPMGIPCLGHHRGRYRGMAGVRGAGGAAGMREAWQGEKLGLGGSVSSDGSLGS
jgi:hypothetical protein